jgi:hypothetical protein
MIEELLDSRFGRCVRMSNGTAEVLAAIDFGPRILRYSLDGGENVLGWHPQARVETELGTWKPYGGHRLWLAPEDMPLSYAPDNGPVSFRVDGETAVNLAASADAAGIQKEIEVRLAENGSEVTLRHRLTNRGPGREMAAWSLTIMQPGGEAIVPNEPFRPYGPDTLLPVRTIALWPYTDLTDPRFTIGSDAIRLRVDETMASPQKFGALNLQGWAAYRWQGFQFTKRCEVRVGAAYPDMNSSTEIYTAGGFVEVEMLSPLATVASGGSLEHTERWELAKVT